MAKKKDNSLSYLQVPLPDTKQSSYRSVKLNWGGLNQKHTLDTGELSMEQNISSVDFPYLTPSEKRTEYCGIEFINPMNLYGFGDCLYVINKDKNVEGDDGCDFVYTDKGLKTHSQLGINLSEYTAKKYGIYGNLYTYKYGAGGGESGGIKYVAKHEPYFVFLNRLKKDNQGEIVRNMRLLTTGYYQGIGEIEEDNTLSITKSNNRTKKDRCLIRFNVFTNPDSPLTSGTSKKILVYPDMVSVSFDDETDPFLVQDFNPNKDLPIFDYATVHNSRVFGVANNKVFASGYNSYVNYKMDTANYSSSENAWYSTSQSNTKSEGDFTGITSYGGHVICFKKDFMHEIYNTKNPFRLKDVYAEGCIDQRTIQEVDGILFFVSEDNVKVYTGGNPEIISYNLGIKQFKNCCAGNDGRNYYLYCEDEKDRKAIYVFDTISKIWSKQETEHEVVDFANTTEGMFLLTKYKKNKDDENYYGKIFKIDTADYNHDWFFETDVMTSLSKIRTIDIKHLTKFQLLAEFSENSSLKVYALYDNEEFDKEKSQLLCDVKNKVGMHPIRILNRNGANRAMKLRFEGYGFIKLYEMELIVRGGGIKDVSAD